MAPRGLGSWKSIMSTTPRPVEVNPRTLLSQIRARLRRRSGRYLFFRSPKQFYGFATNGQKIGIRTLATIQRMKLSGAPIRGKSLKR